MISFTTRQAIIGTLLTIAAGAAIACAVMRIGAQPQQFDVAGYTHTWNDIADSIRKQNPMLADLQADVRANPPGRVRSTRRLELLNQIIAEHERQLKDLKKLRAAEK